MKISQILEKIDEKQLFIPAFQREYVWKRSNAKLLIDSLIKKYPTGTILTWNTSKPPEIKGGHKYTESQGDVCILLDGQQRITTLYMLIKGEIPPYYKVEEIKSDPRGLHVNIETLELEYFSRAKMDGNPCWINITSIFKKDVRITSVVEELQNKGIEVSPATIEEHIIAIISILDRDFVEQAVPATANVSQAIDIFHKVNTGGVKLTDAELALAQISGYWPEARETFKVKLNELKKAGFSFKLDFVVYALLGVMHYNGSDMSKLHGSENNDRIRATWKKLENTVFDYLVKQLRDRAFVGHTDEIKSTYSLVPMIVYCYQNDCRLNENQINKMIKWFYYSQLRSRYSSEVPQKLDRDLRMVKNDPSPFDSLLGVIRDERGGNIKIVSDEFVRKGVGHPLFSLLRWHIKSRGAVCLTEGTLIHGQPVGEKYKLERDHIFSFAKLKAAGYGKKEDGLKYQLAQELTNLAILTKRANRSKGDADVKDYLLEVLENRPESLDLQLIPTDQNLWKIENYEAFLSTRRQMLTDSMNEWLENFADTQVTEIEITLEDLIAQGENEELEFKETLRWDITNEELNRDLEKAILKTIAAFLNSYGGTLLIGVDDTGEIAGLDRDYKSFKNGCDQDKFERHLGGLIDKAFGSTLRSTKKVAISFPEIGDTEICKVEVAKAEAKVFLNEDFFVRSGNASQGLPPSQIEQHWQSR